MKLTQHQPVQLRLRLAQGPQLVRLAQLQQVRRRMDHAADPILASLIQCHVVQASLVQIACAVLIEGK